jgi:hypothetical protein
MRQRPDARDHRRVLDDVKWGAASLRMSLRAVGAAYISEYEIRIKCADPLALRSVVFRIPVERLNRPSTKAEHHRSTGQPHSV